MREELPPHAEETDAKASGDTKSGGHGVIEAVCYSPELTFVLVKKTIDVKGVGRKNFQRFIEDI